MATSVSNNVELSKDVVLLAEDLAKLAPMATNSQSPSQENAIASSAVPPIESDIHTDQNQIDLSKSSKTDPNHWDWQTIPSRVVQYVPLKIAESTIPGAGRGMFALKDVAAGDVIFTIPRPLLLMVSYYPTVDPDHVPVCDNCLAAEFGVNMRHRTCVKEKFTLAACGKCRVMRYCSKECQVTAWKHHHKFECASLRIASPLRQPPPGQQPLWPNPETWAIFVNLIRLFTMQTNGGLTDMEWAEHSSVPVRATSETRDYFKDYSRRWAPLLKSLTNISLSEAQIQNLSMAYMSVHLPFSIPLLNTPLDGVWTWWDKEVKRSTGAFHDPFQGYLNHSCEPNASYCFSGSEYRLLAENSIAAGDELTFNYSQNRGDFLNRQKNMKIYEWTCHCIICMKGQVGLEGPMRDEILSVINGCSCPGHATYRSISTIEKAIDKLRNAGLGPGVYPMAELHIWAFDVYMNPRAPAIGKAIKCALRMYFEILPAQSPATTMMEFHHALHALTSILMDACTLEDVPTGLKMFMPTLYYHLRVRLLSGVEKIFGKDSVVAVYHKQKCEEDERRIIATCPGNCLFVFVGSNDAQANFVESLNKLLDWADVSPVTVESFFPTE